MDLGFEWLVWWTQLSFNPKPTGTPSRYGEYWALVPPSFPFPKELLELAAASMQRRLWSLYPAWSKGLKWRLPKVDLLAQRSFSLLLWILSSPSAHFLHLTIPTSLFSWMFPNELCVRNPHLRLWFCGAGPPSILLRC